jgi:predicted RNA-binding protein with PIN domain
MGQRVGWHRDKPAAQRRLIDEVERLSRSRDEEYLLVFDAKPRDNSNSPDLAVHYSRSGSSADELILELVYRHMESADVTVVTSDRALASQIQVLGAKVMRSGAFRRMLKQHS